MINIFLNAFVEKELPLPSILCMENKPWTFSEAPIKAAEIFWRSVLNSLNIGIGCPDSCGVSITGNTQNLIEYFPLYPALADPALAMPGMM